MDDRARESYLRTQVMTATPQRLQLLMLDGALRFATQAQAAWAEGDTTRASEQLDRCRQVIAEMLSGVQPSSGEVARRVFGLYAWLFRSLAEAQLTRNSEMLGEVVKVLQVERETWRQVCDQLPDSPRPAASNPAADSRFTSAASENSTDSHPDKPKSTPLIDMEPPNSPARFSLEA